MTIIDLPGALLHAETDEHIILGLKGKLVEMMTMVDPKLYRKYAMTNHKDQSMLYIKMHKAIY